MTKEIQRLFDAQRALNSAADPLRGVRQHLEGLGDASRQLGIGAATMEFMKRDDALRKLAAGLASGGPAVQALLANAQSVRLVGEHHDALKTMIEGTNIRKLYEGLFRLPKASELSGLADLALQLKGFVGATSRDVGSLRAAMAAMHSPWLELNKTLESAKAFSEILAIGRGIDIVRPFNVQFSESLRTMLGDWREAQSPAPGLLLDPVLRSAFYIERGFDSALTNFTPAAFEETLQFADLRTCTDDAERDATNDATRAQEAFSRLFHLEIEVRRFIMRVMCEAFGDDWMQRQIPPSMLNAWIEKRATAVKIGSTAAQLIDYADFSDYKQIIERKDNWRIVFSKFFTRPEDIRESFQRLFPVRIATMHARPITQDDMLLLLVEMKRVMNAMERGFTR